VTGPVHLVEYVDLTDHVHIDVFDMVMRAIESVVESSESLSMDSASDRAALIRRLQVAVGAVP
jgi:hypothetical protein